ncbi:MAG: Maf family protein [Bacilli bacterium]|jgi:septum formation protein|nr:Maf family protein [Bacillota bacterium]NLM31524.1 septum formation protein Maf [Acholeplasmataceae bacterium]HOA77904.1 Maf family protein [Bacilli bacterium]HPZ26784.1 Maf family protein [Bacilli bacterium]HQC89253.1 Maf family protein [Bacilli bacterium]
MKVVLASQSPRRRELMRRLGFDYITATADVNEDNNNRVVPREYARETALKKAEAVMPKHPDSLVVAADTIVALDERILGKPRSNEEAKEMLALLSGRHHFVYTGVALGFRGVCRSFVEKTKVFVSELSPDEIAEYIRTGEPFDKAGAYGIQGAFGKFIRRIEGDYYNVMGLPINRLYREIKKIMSKKR